MSIYDRQVRGRPINPGKALYDYWFSIIEPWLESNNGWPYKFLYFGTSRDYGIGVLPKHQYDTWGDSRDDPEYGTPSKPNLGLGHGGTPLFTINSQGEFKMNYRPHGDHQRNVISKHTFLDWTHYRSEYQWFVNLSPKHQAQDLDDWQNPIPYVSQGRALTGLGYYRRAGWMKLEHEGGNNWRIAFSRRSKLKIMENNSGVFSVSKNDFDQYEALRNRRYVLLERRARINSGELTVRNRQVVTTQEKNERLNQGTEALTPHLQVLSPHKTNPMKRTLEGV